jgi:DnaJ like chaperone protein
MALSLSIIAIHHSIVIISPVGTILKQPVKEESIPVWAATLAFLIPILILILVLLYQKRRYGLRKVEKGVFKQNLPHTRDNLFEAYLCLAVLMIQKETVDAGKKHIYIKKYFLTYFPENYYNFSETILEYYKSEPIQVDSVALWINNFVKDYGKKTHILYFLAGISMVDGEIVPTEMALLREMALLLNVAEEDLESILNTYSYYGFKKKRTSSSRSKSVDTSMLTSAFKILSLDNGATIAQVKASYRKMAKLHHPDTFSNENEVQQKIAHERFVKINEAYEYVLKSLN